MAFSRLGGRHIPHQSLSIGISEEEDVMTI